MRNIGMYFISLHLFQYQKLVLIQLDFLAIRHKLGPRFKTYVFKKFKRQIIELFENLRKFLLLNKGVPKTIALASRNFQNLSYMYFEYLSKYSFTFKAPLNSVFHTAVLSDIHVSPIRGISWEYRVSSVSHVTGH